MAFNIGLARLIGFCVDIALSVIYTILFAASLYTLRRRNTNTSRVIPVVLVFQFLLNTAQLCLQGADIYLAFFRWDDPGGPSSYFLDCTSRILPARDAIFWTLSILTDALLVRPDIVGLGPPVLTTVLSAGGCTGIVMYIYTIRRMLENSMHLSPEIDQWWMITAGFTLAINVIVPGLIIGRLWYIARTVGVLGSKSSWPYTQIALALMESGVLYTIFISAWLIIFQYGSLAALFLSACLLPTIVATVPTLVILRIHTLGHDPVAHLRQTGGNAFPVQIQFKTTVDVQVSERRVKDLGLPLHRGESRSTGSDGDEGKDDRPPNVHPMRGAVV
ncbi:hypothetical protein FRB99_000623 [Tulasnella sp. 403]|nr:hypothetical protein FRB99_000623 [Tulasnella sp. 403]